MKKGWRQTAFCRSGNKNLPLRHPNGRGALLRLVPAILAILAAIILPSPAVCGDNPPAVTESSRTYKDPACNFMVKDLENEIAETTASLKNCQPAGQTGGTQSSLSPKAAAARAKECEQYERKLKLTKENLLHVKEQCDKGLTPDSLPKVIEDPNAVPCAQCGTNKAPPREPPAKMLTGLPVSGKVLDLKAGDPNLRTVFGKSAAAPALAAAGVPPAGEPYVDCVCPDGRSLGWMYLSECTSKRVTSCGATQPPPVIQPPPVVQPPVEPPPVVVPPTEPPPSTTQPPDEKPDWAKKAWNWIKELPGKIWNGIKKVFREIADPLQGVFVAVRNWIFNKPDYATVVCDGNGGYKIQLNEFEDAPCGIEECVLKHEQTHVEHLNAVYPGTFSPCAGVKAGTQVPLSDKPAFINFSECAAHSGEIGCLGGRLSQGQSSYCLSKLNERISIVKENKEKLKCP